MRPLFYIHQASCISPQETFQQVNLDTLHNPVGKKMLSVEPGYENIPLGILRRMGRAVRIGVGAAIPIIKETTATDGIIIGTANGGMEDCFKFLNQIIQYEEGQLTPGNFVQSTTNAIAAQLGILNSNKSYNITHVHRGLSFENAVIDAAMQLVENKNNSYLLGAVDEISAYNFNIEYLGNWYKDEEITASELYTSDTKGSIAGEGAAMFLVNNEKENAIAKMQAIHMVHSEDEELVQHQLRHFIDTHLPAGEKIDLLLSGENGDNRILKYYTVAEHLMDEDVTIARFKHMTGEFTTASAIATWLAIHILQQQQMPAHMIKRAGHTSTYKNILICNNYRGVQHGFILIRPVA